jgi:hypothetical protein
LKFLIAFISHWARVEETQVRRRKTRLHSSKDMMHSSENGERSNPEPIASEKVTHERKLFFLDLKENQRGRFLKITEDVGGRRDTIMLPAPAFREFLEALQRLVEFEEKL